MKEIAKPKPEYRAYIELKGGIYKFGSESFRRRQDALSDAANIVREAKASPECEWADEIVIYGTYRTDKPAPRGQDRKGDRNE